MKTIAHYDAYLRKLRSGLWARGKGFILHWNHEYDYGLDSEQREALAPAIIRYERDHMGMPFTRYLAASGHSVGTMHAFRHGRASQMQAAGLPGNFVTSQTGHSSLKITSIYTHLSMRKSVLWQSNCCLELKTAVCTQPRTEVAYLK